jgi:hypothetical protein
VGGYLYTVGLDRADKLGSAIGALAAVVAVAAPYLLPAPRPHPAPTPPAAPPASAPPTRIDLREARGVQINQGGINTQTNTFTEAP